MSITVTKVQLVRIPTEQGGPLIMGVFKVQLQNPYTVGGEIVDLSSYVRQVLDLEIQSNQASPGYDFVVDDTNFATALPKIKALALSHAHTLLVKNNAGAAMTMNVSATVFEAKTGAGDFTVGAGLAGGGVQTLASQAEAEVGAIDLSAVVLRIRVWGLG